jgi:hypothetical protein
MSRRKKIRFRVSDGPVPVDTEFLEDSPEGQGAWYLKQGEIEPRRGVALGLRVLFNPLGAAMRGQSIEQVEALILSSERCFSDFMRQAREQAQCNHQSSSEKPIPHPKGTGTEEEARDEISNAIDNFPSNGLLVNPNEDLSDLFN